MKQLVERIAVKVWVNLIWTSLNFARQRCKQNLWIINFWSSTTYITYSFQVTITSRSGFTTQWDHGALPEGSEVRVASLFSDASPAAKKTVDCRWSCLVDGEKVRHKRQSLKSTSSKNSSNDPQLFCICVRGGEKKTVVENSWGARYGHTWKAIKLQLPNSLAVSFAVLQR